MNDDRDAFDWAWDMLAEAGACDARFSTEYERLRAEWDALESPYQAMEFIKREANKPPAAPRKKKGGAS